MKIFIDGDFCCHLIDDGNMRSIETTAFDGKCKEYIEGYRFVPFGETWIREDGTIFHGEMVSPVKNALMLDKIQSQHEVDEFTRFSDLGIPQEQDFTATRNYSVGSFVSIYGQLYEVIRAIPVHSSILNRQNIIKTTVEHYLDTLKEE